MEHPFGSYPYRQRSATPENYVGPAWAAPAPKLPPATPPPESWQSKLGRVIGFCLFFINFTCVATCAGWILQEPYEPEPWESDPTLYEFEEPQRPDCWGLNDDERSEEFYGKFDDEGSAGRLEGRVAMVALQVAGGRESWTRKLRDRVQFASLEACQFLEREAARHARPPIDCRVLPVALPSVAIELPTVLYDDRDITSDDSVLALAELVDQTVRQALGRDMKEAVEYYQDGPGAYDEVAFLAYFPLQTEARDFAMPRWGDEPEIAVLFAASEEPTELAVTTAHEGLHLFGAADLYRVKPYDARDKHDIMGIHCDRFGASASIENSTGYAVGWSDSPPERSYPFK